LKATCAGGGIGTYAAQLAVARGVVVTGVRSGGQDRRRHLSPPPGFIPN
jgi:NADPH:quinone reductase-like Zn-dependent oxidoreductase